MLVRRYNAAIDRAARALLEREALSCEEIEALIREARFGRRSPWYQHSHCPCGAATLEHWRAALLAYLPRRCESRCGSCSAEEVTLNHPEMTRTEARQEIVEAIGWVVVYRGIPKLAWIWPATAEGVGTPGPSSAAYTEFVGITCKLQLTAAI